MINYYYQVTSETNFEGDVQLTSFTDYALRALIYMATLPEGKMTSISEVTELYKLSRHQMVKIVNQLGHEGLVSASRGKKGGIRLGRPAAEINIGDVVRQLEPLELINCDTSLMTSSCDLKKILHQAMQQFLQELDNYTLADIAHYRDLKHIFISDAAEIKTY